MANAEEVYSETGVCDFKTPRFEKKEESCGCLRPPASIEEFMEKALSMVSAPKSEVAPEIELCPGVKISYCMTSFRFLRHFLEDSSRFS